MSRNTMPNGRRGMDGGLAAPKTCKLVPPPLRPGPLDSTLWAAWCLSCERAESGPLFHVNNEATRELAIVAHRGHVEAEHAEGVES